MIELPEAIVIARQMNEVLRGKRVENALRGNSPHKFAFYNRPPEEYAALLKGRTMGEAYPFGACIVAPVEPEYALMLGGGGERIHVHREESALPKKHQLLLRFDDGAFLSVTVQGWGCAQLFHQSEVTDPCRPGEVRVSPASDAFTYEYFRALLAQVPEDDSRSVKFVVISRPGVWGIGNGTLQDILFRAGLHPRRRAVGLSEAERRALYEATRHTVQE